MIFETVREILARQMEVRPEDINRDTDIIEDLSADSLDIVELVMTIEEEYDIVIKDESVGSMTKVGEIVDYLEKIL